jgi:hypothetical protein
MTEIACDMTNAPDTPQERLAEYQQLFATALISRERTDTGIRFRLRHDTLDQVRALAAKEKQCCPFFEFQVTVDGDAVVWDASVVDDPLAREILDAFYDLAQVDQADSSSAFGGLCERVRVIQ